MDNRVKKLAKQLVNYSCDVKYGDNVLVTLLDAPIDIGLALISEIRNVGGKPFLNIQSNRINAAINREIGEEELKIKSESDLNMLKGMQATIYIHGSNNIFETSDVNDDQNILIGKYYNPVRDFRCYNTKWSLLIWPTPAAAQLAGMSTEQFEDFYFSVCNFDYKKMESGANALKELMAKTDKVRIVAPETDISFSIKNIGASVCIGNFNIPDGEVYSCPVRDSVNGKIKFNTPTEYNGILFNDIEFVVKNGKIIEAKSSSNRDRLNKILDSDEGARYFGEFALGFNPLITKPMRDILFDEKIAGSLHITPGSAYKDTWNGNDSMVHWDMVLIQTPEMGGGEIWFDDVLIRKDGEFIIDDLKALNKENLLK